MTPVSSSSSAPSSAHADSRIEPTLGTLRESAGADTSGFAPTGFGSTAAQQGVGVSEGAVFDLCRGALALRVLLVVNGSVVLAVMLSAPRLEQAVGALGPALMMALPASLLWLALVCAGQKWLARTGVLPRGIALTMLGGVLAAASALPLVALNLLEMTPLRSVTLPLAGMAFALVGVVWLQWREAHRRPAEADARVAELQARIRPHFLFNTLNTAIALVRTDPERAEGVLEDLAELFRVALEQDGATVTLASEIELARRYLAIEQLRFADRLRLHWQIDPAAGAARLPPLVLQPLVENAIRHGVEPSRQPSDVTVRASVRGGRAEVHIDNPMPEAPSAPGHGMALANVRARLRLLYDLDGRLDTTVRNGRFHVRLRVPLAPQ
jgi:two-component system, LytTR family, sensor histidine kinase AlgZ